MKLYYKILIIIAAFFMVIAFSRIFSSISAKTKRDIKVPEISINKALEFYKNKSAIFIDPRDKAFYNAERIDGALSYPLQNFVKWKEKIKNKINYDQKIIVYCDNYMCSMSTIMAQKLIIMGYVNVYVLKGGIEKWKEKQYPMQYSF